jgi:hypothetical protein
MKNKGMNTHVVHTIPYARGIIGRVLLATEKDDSRSKIKPIKVAASYCPFCGEKYADSVEVK